MIRVNRADEEHGAECGAKYAVSRCDLDADALIIGEPGGIRADYDSLHEDGLRDWESTMNLAMTYAGGYGDGVLPEFVTTTVEIRTIPGQDPDDLLSELRVALFLSNARTGAAEAFGHRLSESVFPGTTDTTWFAKAYPRMACLPALGPGLLRHAHGDPRRHGGENNGLPDQQLAALR